MKGKILLLASAAAFVALSSAPASAADWWENTSISGRMYYDFTNISASNTNGGVKTDSSANGTGFDIKRFYVGIDHKFNDMFSANITTDFQYSATVGATELFIKKAYLQAKFDPAFVVRLGATDMPWIPYVEGVYGYRYVEQTLIDRSKFGTSSDWGLHFMGDLAGKLISYQVSVVNGNGYKNTSRGDSVDFEGRVSLNYDGFMAAIGGYDGKLGAAHNSVAAGTCAVGSPITSSCHDATRFDALLAYVGNGARIGVEYFETTNWKSVKVSTTDKATGYSVFASYDFTPQWAVFGKYDYVNPKLNGGQNPGSVKDNYYNIGLQYSPFKMVNFSLVYKHDNAKGGAISTGNGTIGVNGASAAASALNKGDYNEVGLFGSFQW